MKFNRIIIIVLDGVGAGALPDADKYGDAQSNTLLHIQQTAGLSLPNLAHLGLANIIPLDDSARVGAWGTMMERSQGKDTTTGHWEIAGVVLPQAFPTYPNGFPKEIIDKFCEEIGSSGILGNYPASGTEIIQVLGDEHVATKKPIVYTSADSVFQIAAHEEVIPVARLYEICKIAREILCGEHSVSRVIARPFEGTSGDYSRTKNRKDFSVLPPQPTVLDMLQAANYETIGVGKISDIFAAQGITESFPVKGNEACVEVTLDILKKNKGHLVFVNLVDFDMLYGHRNDPQGFKRALENFDRQVPEICESLQEKDLLIITADHGNDPTTPSTDHSREYVPLLAYHKNMLKIIDLGVRQSFSDIAKTIDENFSLNQVVQGTSFLEDL